MEEKEGFIKNSQMAVKGVANGIFGAFVYELILTLLFSLVITTIVTRQNPGASEEELNALANNMFDKYPFSLIISCVGNIITLVVFTIIIKFNTFKELCKKAINVKTIKYGLIGALCIMGFSIIYNSSIVSIFGLDSSGNSNQENVVTLIKSNVLLGFLSVVVFAPFVEELTYRYCLFGGTSKKKRWIGYLISGVVFMLMHSISSFMEIGFKKELLTEFLYLPPYLFSGLALCYLYDKSENLGSSFIAHMLNNLVSFLSIVCL